MVQFYYRDVIKMTITRAKGEGNGHFLSHRGNRFYHFIRSHSLVVFISLIEKHEKMNFYWKFTSKFGIIFVLQSFTGQSYFLAFAYYASFDAPLCAQPRSCARGQWQWKTLIKSKITLQSRARPMLILIHSPTSDFTCTAHAATLRDTHRIHVYYDSERTRNARAMK